MFIGELISLGVAVSWTATALFAEVGSKRMGSLPFNTIRMTMSLVFLAVTLWLVMGVPYPRYADGSTWMWLLLSGLVGYVIGDYCLMQGYIKIGSRFGQLFMTLSAPTAAVTGRLLLGEQMRPIAIVGMVVTLSGIALSILSKSDKSDHHAIHFKLPAKGIFFAAMAGICQGFGLVLSKVGLTHYDAALTAAGISGDSVFAIGGLFPDAGFVQQRWTCPVASRRERPQGDVVRAGIHYIRAFHRSQRVAIGHAIHLSGHRPDTLRTHPHTHHRPCSHPIPSKGDLARSHRRCHQCRWSVFVFCVTHWISQKKMRNQNPCPAS